MTAINTHKQKRATSYFVLSALTLIIAIAIVSCRQQNNDYYGTFRQRVTRIDSLYSVGMTEEASKELEDLTELAAYPREIADVTLQANEMKIPAAYDEIKKAVRLYDTLTVCSRYDAKMKYRAAMCGIELASETSDLDMLDSFTDSAASMANYLGYNEQYVALKKALLSDELHRGKYVEAILGYRELLEYCMNYDMPHHAFRILYTLENAFLTIGDLPRAQMYLDEIEVIADGSMMSKLCQELATSRLFMEKTDTFGLGRCIAKLKKMYTIPDLDDRARFEIDCRLADYYIFSRRLDSANVIIHRMGRVRDRIVLDAENRVKLSLFEAQLKLAQGKTEAAKSELDKINRWALKIHDVDAYEKYTGILSDYYVKIGDDEHAYSFLKEMTALMDSLKRESVSHDIAYRSLALRRDTTIVAQKVKIEQQRGVKERLLLIRLLGLGAIMLVAAVGILAYFYASYKRIKKRWLDIENEKQELAEEVRLRNKTLREQKRLLTEKSDVLLKELEYAHHIQSNILPPNAILDVVEFKDFFVFYRPSNLVSGDFYWFFDKGEQLFVGVGDATGHGIPGAFIAMVASTILNDLVSSEDYCSALQLMRDFDNSLSAVIRNTSDIINKDSVDFSLMCIDRNKKRISLSLARHTALLVKADGTTVRLNGVKRSICETDLTVAKNKEYEEMTIECEEDDCLYMMSDGYESQFGGAEDRKLNRRRLFEYLTELHEQPMEIQSMELGKRFDKWRGKQEQTDDVLIVGIRMAKII